jgi:hypothetical protein
VKSSSGKQQKYVNGTNSTKQKINQWERISVQRPDVPSFNGCKVVVLGVGQHFLHMGNEYLLANGKVVSELAAYEAATASVRDAVLASNVTRHAQVFYRTFSSDHFYGGWYYANGSCRDIDAPYEKPLRTEYSHGTYLENHTVDMRNAALRVFRRTSVRVLDVTSMSDARGDMHRAVQRSSGNEDCVHSCLGGMPSVPDYWNWLLVLSLRS